MARREAHTPWVPLARIEDAFRRDKRAFLAGTYRLTVEEVPTPEPGPGPGEGRAFRVMRLAWLALAIGAVIVLYMLLR